MDMKCDLKSIYSSIDSEDFKADLSKFNTHISNVIIWCERNPVDNIIGKLEKYLKFYNEYKNLYLKLSCYTYFLVSLDGQNVEAMDMLDEIEEKNDEFMRSFVIFTNWLKGTENLDEIIDSSKYLLKHKFYLKEVFSKSKYILSEKEEQLIKKMQITGSRGWQRLYMEVVSSTNIKVKVNGELKRFSFGELKNVAYDNDANLRKLAFKAEKKACKNISQCISSCINELSGEAINIYDMKGYESVINKVLLDSRMDKETLNTMIEVIEDNLSIFHKYFKIKAKVLGKENKLPFYDIYAPIGKGYEKISYGDCINLIISGFKNFSDDLSNFAKKVFDERWVDAESTTTKGNYALSVDIFPINENRIMTNFSGNYMDILILSHEIGHAYHSYCLKDQELLNTDYPIPIAETASIFCETIMNNELISNAKKDDKIMMLERSISSAAYFIVEMYGRFLFEYELFKKRNEGILSVSELNEIMKNSIKKVYGNTVDRNSINSYSWINNIGYYMAGNEFLNFPYIFGILFSKGLYSEYLKNKKVFVNNYNEFLKITSVNNIYDVAKFMNIDINSRDFWESAFKVIKDDIDEFCQYVLK